MSKVHSLSLLDRVRYAYLAYFSKPKADRAVYRAVHKVKPKTIVEIGVGSAERAVRAISLAAKHQPGERIAFTAVDMFEASPPGRASLGLKKAHQHLSATGAKIQLVPGDPFSALARMANSLMGTDLLIIAADQQARRSLTQRLLAPALMEATKDTPYDNATDEGWGANAEQLDVLREAVLGSERIAHQSGKLATDPAARKLETDMLVNAVKEGDVPVALLMALRPGDPKGEGLHWVLVTGREVRDGVEYLRVVNPWGQEELMTRAELENRMRGQVVEGSCEA